MINMLWPVLVVVISNVFYNICQKSTPSGVNVFVTLMVTYFIAAVICLFIISFTIGFSGLVGEFQKLNWTSFVLGIAIIGLEIGFLFLYRVGWKLSVGTIVCNISLALVLLFVGVRFYHETVNIKQLIGIILCSGGLALITI